MSSETSRAVRTLRSVGAVFAGLVAVVVLSEGTDFVLRSAGIFPPREQVDAYSTSMFLGATIYRTAAGVVGGFIAAALALRAPMGHALALGIVGFLLSMVGLIAMWGVGPAWYPVALAMLAPPAAWLGGRLHQIHAARVTA